MDKAAYRYDLPVFLLGHSMGGLITIRLLQEEKLNIAGVILSSPCLGLIHAPSKFLDVSSHLINVIFPTLRMNSGITVQMATRNEEVWEADSGDTLYITKVSVRWYRELATAIKQAFLVMDKTQDVPLLVMQAGEDKIVNKDSVKEWFNQAPLSEKRFKVWPKCYHEIFNEPEREDVFRVCKGFCYQPIKSHWLYCIKGGRFSSDARQLNVQGLSPNYSSRSPRT